jgi:integration host factor subunit alpha
MALTKARIIDEIHNQLRFSKKKSVELTETLLELMKKTLENGEDVLISGFGKFCVREKRQRRGRNPATGEDLILRPRRVVTFKCSGKLREQVNAKEPGGREQ